MVPEWLVAAAGIFGGGALTSFVQFLISRHDEKDGEKDALMTEIKGIREELDAIKEKQAEDRANDARIRILRFSDEVRHKLRHSKEYFDQINTDIDTYEQYCKDHPDYQNNRAVMAIQNIKRVYLKCLEQNDFLE